MKVIVDGEEVDTERFKDHGFYDERELVRALEGGWYPGGDRCQSCGGSMTWCSCCQCWTQNCCVDYGTCMCS